MTTADLRIAEASVGEGAGIKRPRRGAGAVIGTISHESLCISVLWSSVTVSFAAPTRNLLVLRSVVSGTRVRTALLTLHRRGSCCRRSFWILSVN